MAFFIVRQSEILEYVNTLTKMTKEIKNSYHCGDVVIDTIVNSSFYLANRQDTNFIANISLSQPLDIDRVHLTTILCNLLDNALEACSKLPADKRNMYLTLTFDSNLLSITVKNAYDPKNIDLQNGIAYTTKADKAMHGIGLKRVKKTVEKFNGTFKYYTEDSDEESSFIAEAMLYL